MANKYLGIDLGTSGVKVALMDESGRLVKSVTKSYSLLFLHPLWSEQNPLDWYQATQEAVTEVLVGFPSDELRSISFSGQMHGLVILDEKDTLLRHAILWNDQRTQKQCDYLNHTIGQSKISDYTANMALTGFTAPKLLWVQENEPDIFAKIAKIMLPKDYLIYQMTGIFVTDPSDAAGTLLLDVAHQKWSEKMLKLIGVTEKQLPKIIASSAVVGSLKPELLQLWGLKSGCVVVTGGADNAVAGIGTSTIRDGNTLLSLGTSGVIYVASEKFTPVKDNQLHCFCSCTGEFYHMGVILSAAASLKWWVESIHKSTDYEDFLAEVKTLPVENSIFFLPYLSGERTPVNDALVQGEFFGLTQNHERKHMTQAVLEGVAFALKDSFEIMKTLGHKIDKVTIVGGGAKSPIWVQMISDILNVNLQMADSQFGPAYGACLLAYAGLHKNRSIQQICEEFIHLDDCASPNPLRAAQYAHKYKKYTQLYPAIRQLFHP